MTIPPGMFIGGARGTQVCDIIHPISLALSIGRDRGGTVAAGQADITAFYDNIDPVLVWRRFEKRMKKEAVWLAIAVRLQLVPIVRFAVGDVILPLRHRTCGSLTGSKTAGSLGRLIVVDSMVKAVSQPSFRGYMSAAGQLTLSSWIDNLYCLAPTPGCAATNFMILDGVLQRDWRLTFKESSKLIISSAGKMSEFFPGGYRWSEPFPVLGASLDSHGSCDADMEVARSACMRRFWSGAGAKRHSCLPFGILRRDLHRVCWPALLWRCSWWPICKTKLDSVNSLQRELIGYIVRIARRPGESDRGFAIRRGIEISQLLPPNERWGTLIAERVVSWHAHAQRNHCRSWSGFLCGERTISKTQFQRAWSGSSSCVSGSLGSRQESGRPRTRFEEGVVCAQSAIDKAISESEAIEQKLIAQTPKREMTWLSRAEFQLRSITGKTGWQ